MSFPTTLYCRIKMLLSAQQLSYCFWRIDIILTPSLPWEVLYNMILFSPHFYQHDHHHLQPSFHFRAQPYRYFLPFCNIKIWRRWMKVSCMFLSVYFYSSHEQWWTWQPRDWNPLFNHRLGIVRQKDIFLYTTPVACLSLELESLSSISEKKHSGQSVPGLISGTVEKKHSCYWVSWQVLMSSLEWTESSLSLIWEFLSVSYWENVVFYPVWKLYICVLQVVTYLFKGSRFSDQLAFSHGLDLKLINVCDFFFFTFYLCKLSKSNS